MTARGRPTLTNPPTIVQVKLRLYDGEDNDLLAFFGRIPTGHRADAVKAALRSGQIGAVEVADLPSDDDMLDDLAELLL